MGLRWNLKETTDDSYIFFLSILPCTNLKKYGDQRAGPLHKTFTGETTLVKSENSGKHNFTIDFTI